VKLTQTATLPTYFMALAGIKSLSITASALASMQGQSQGWNVAIIVDGTQSMSTKDSNCGNLTEFECALSGVQTFLAVTNPCSSGYSSCTPSSNSNLRVALFSFPNLSTSNFSDTSTCSGSFASEPYTLPTTSATTYSSISYSGQSQYAATYQITDWDTGYYEPSSTSTYGLNASDNLVEAVGYGYNSSTGAIAHEGCLPNKGGQSTYYGGVIYAAQAALVEAQKNYGGKNAIILLSDGQANAASSKFPSATSTASSSSPYSAAISVTSSGSTSGGTNAYNLTGAAGTFGLYPDFTDECQQAIMAAQAAAAAGTRVYAVAYGSEDTGCTGSGGTDTTLVATGNNNVSFTVTSTGGTLLPCVTMENIANPESGNSASWQTYFFSDNQQSGSGVDTSCINSQYTVTSLQDIFLAINATFSTPRLLPANAQ
jgi:hypothetical protein